LVFMSVYLLCLRRDTFFQQLKKVSKESRHCAWSVLMVFSVFMGGGHPYLPVPFPPCPRVPHVPSAHTHHIHPNCTTAHTTRGWD
jgi:hypothetical protein